MISVNRWVYMLIIQRQRCRDGDRTHKMAAALTILRRWTFQSAAVHVLKPTFYISASVIGWFCRNYEIYFWFRNDDFQRLSVLQKCTRRGYQFCFCRLGCFIQLLVVCEHVKIFGDKTLEKRDLLTQCLVRTPEHTPRGALHLFICHVVKGVESGESTFSPSLSFSVAAY